MDTAKNTNDHTQSKMEVLDLQELDAVEAGMAAMQWGMYSLECDAYAWSTLSAECQ